MVFASIIPSTPEIIIVLVIALIVFGPQKLPEIGRQVGSALRELNKMRGDVQRALDLDGFDRDSYSSYGNGAHYDANPYGAAGSYAAVSTDTPAETPQLTGGMSQTDADGSHYDSGHLAAATAGHESDHDLGHEMALEAHSAPSDNVPSPGPMEFQPPAATYIPHTVSVSAGSTVAHDIEPALSHGAGHTFEAASDHVSHRDAAGSGQAETASAAAASTSEATAHTGTDTGGAQSVHVAATQ